MPACCPRAGRPGAPCTLSGLTGCLSGPGINSTSFVKSKTLPFTHLQPPSSRDLSLSKIQQETNQEVQVADASAQPSYFLSQLHRTSRLCGVTLVHGCRAAAGRAVHSPGPPGRSLVPGEASCYAARPGVQTIRFLTHLGHLLH